MTTPETAALETAADEASEDEFFESVAAFEAREDNLPFDLLRPSDPVLARKMSQPVRLRRARLGRMVAAVVVSAVAIGIAAMAHVRVPGLADEESGAPSWAVSRGLAETHTMMKASIEPELGAAAAAAAATVEAPEGVGTSSAL
jgi:hypothetical protein